MDCLLCLLPVVYLAALNLSSSCVFSRVKKMQRQLPQGRTAATAALKTKEWRAFGLGYIVGSCCGRMWFVNYFAHVLLLFLLFPCIQTGCRVSVMCFEPKLDCNGTELEAHVGQEVFKLNIFCVAHGWQEYAGVIFCWMAFSEFAMTSDILLARKLPFPKNTDLGRQFLLVLN